MVDNLVESRESNSSPAERGTEIHDLRQRLNNWVNERKQNILPERFQPEANARRQIVTAMKKDLKVPISPEEVLVRMKKSILPLESRELPVEVEKRDTITGEIFKTCFRREGSAWVAEEVRNGDIISQARISDSGRTELTLHFIGPRYRERNANPDITVDSRFPSATVKVFDLLVKTLKMSS